MSESKAVQACRALVGVVGMAGDPGLADALRLAREAVAEADAGPEPCGSRWTVEPTTSPSGKTLFRCGICGRVSQTPDKTCPHPECTEPAPDAEPETEPGPNVAEAVRGILLDPDHAGMSEETERLLRAAAGAEPEPCGTCAEPAPVTPADTEAARAWLALMPRGTHERVVSLARFRAEARAEGAELARLKAILSADEEPEIVHLPNGRVATRDQPAPDLYSAGYRKAEDDAVEIRKANEKAAADRFLVRQLTRERDEARAAFDRASDVVNEQHANAVREIERLKAKVNALVLPAPPPEDAP